MQKYENGKLQEIDFWSEEGYHSVKKGFGTSLLKYESGQKKSQQTFANSKLDGKVTTWYENGKIETETKYSKGQPCGVWFYYDSLGVLESSIQQGSACDFD